MGIVQARHRHAAFEIDHPAAGSSDGIGASIVPDVEDLAIPDHDRLGPGLLRIDRVDRAIAQHEIGGLVAGREAQGEQEERDDGELRSLHGRHVADAS